MWKWPTGWAQTNAICLQPAGAYISGSYRKIFNSGIRKSQATGKYNIINMGAVQTRCTDRELNLVFRSQDHSREYLFQRPAGEKVLFSK